MSLARKISIHADHLTDPQEGPANSVSQNQTEWFQIGQLRYKGEINALEKLMSDPIFREELTRTVEASNPFNSRRELLKKSMRLNRSLVPHLHQIGDHVRASLGIKGQIHFFVYQDSSFNAFCLPPSDDQFYVLLTSGLLENFEPDELTFVIGHELGHALLEHHVMPITTLAQNHNKSLSPLHILRLCSWSRSAEISADRAGLLCSGDFQAVARALLKLSSGMSKGFSDVQISSYLDQYRELRAELHSEQASPEDWYSSHPFSPLRLKALELFTMSDAFASSSSRSESRISSEEMEREIHSFMSLIEPAQLADATDGFETFREFAFISGFLVAASNGVLERNELLALSQLVGRPLQEQEIEVLVHTDIPTLVKRITDMAKEINFSQPAMRRLSLMRDLIVVSGADGTIEASEIQALYFLCDVMQIRRDFVDDTLNSALKNT